MQRKYYSELNEIPLYNFEMCMNGNYSYIRKDGREKWGKAEVMAFMYIYEKYTQKYNKKDLDSKVMLYKSLIQLQCAYIETGDEYFLTQIDIKKAQLPKQKEQKQESNTTQILVVLSQFQGYRLDPKEISVDEYLSIKKSYERENKKV